MAKTLKPVYQRKDVIAEAINKGKKIQGLRGFVPCEMKCCCGSTVVYVPVRVAGIKLEGCSSTLSCQIDPDGITGNDGTLRVLSFKETFDVQTDNFYPNFAEVQAWEVFRKTKKAWEKDNNRLGYSSDAHGRKRAFQQFVLESGVLDKHPAVKEKLDAAVEDAGSISKIRSDERDNITRLAILYTHFPNADEDFDPNNFDS